MKRIQRGGSVRGISLKLQEEERERRLDFIPEKSILDVDTVDIDADTFDLLKSIDFADLPGVAVQAQQHVGTNKRGDRKPRQGGDKKEHRERKPRPAKAEATPAAAPASTQ